MAQARYQLLATINLGSPTGDDLALALSLPTGIYGVSYVGALIGSGGTLPYTYAISSDSLPTGLSLDGSTGAVTGTPTVQGRYEFTAAVTDAASNTVSKVVAILVVSGIVFAQVFAPGEVGIAYSSGISASGGTPPYTWAVTSGSLPTSTSIDSSTGIVSGTPSADGTFNFTLTATDSASNTQDFPTSITIAAAVALSGTFAPGVVGLQYSAAPSLTGGVAPFTFAITSGAIPTGCSFSTSSGTVSGVCTAAATYAFDITVTDFLGGTDTSSQSVVFSDAWTGGSGIETINTVAPDGGGDFTIKSSDASVTITPITNGIDITTSGSYVAPQARLATAAALPTNTYANGASGVGATLTAVATGTLTVDGVAVAIGNNVLVKNESTASHNGLYTCTVAGALGVAYILTRTTGMDQPAEFLNTLVPVGPEGSTNADTLWQSVPVPPVTVGTTAIPFVKDSGTAGALLAANNLSDVANATTSFDNIAPASATKGDILVYNGTHWVKHTHGVDGGLVQFDSSQADGLRNIVVPNIPILTLEQEIAADSPLLWYKLNEAAGATVFVNSGSASGCNATIASPVSPGRTLLYPNQNTSDRFARFNNFGAPGTQVAVNPLGTTTPNSSYTVEAVICYDSTASITASTLFAFNNNANGTMYFFLGVTSNGGVIQVFQGSNTFNFSGAASAILCRTVHVVIVLDATAKTVDCWVNGKHYFDTKTFSTAYSTTITAPRIWIGLDQNNANFYQGAAAHLAFYHGVKLSEARILAHANAVGTFLT